MSGEPCSRVKVLGFRINQEKTKKTNGGTLIRDLRGYFGVI